MELNYNRKTRFIIFFLRISLGLILIATAVSFSQAESIQHQIIFYVAAFLGAALIIGFQVKKISLISCIFMLILVLSMVPVSKRYFIFPLLIIVSSLSFLLLSQIDNHPLCIRTRKRKLGMAKK